MTIGDKIRKLRRERNWTQDELGKKIGVHGRHLSRYENDHIMPPKKVLKRLAEVFETTEEELLYENGKERLTSLIKDEGLLKQFQEAEEFGDEDKLVVKNFMDAMITKKRMQDLLSKRK